MKPVFMAVGVVFAWSGPVAEAGAAPKRICVDVHIRSARSLLRNKKQTPKQAQQTPARRVAPRAAPPPRRRLPRPAVAPGTGPTAQPAPTPRPGPESSKWVDPVHRKQLLRQIFRKGFRAGNRDSNRRWRRYLKGRGGKQFPYPPAAFLRRLVEHYVTHAKGYLAVTEGCAERITIEMYPIKGGWTVFARNSKRAREEKVDLVTYGELTRFAERVVIALLKGRHIAATANLRTILKADSMRSYRTIKGSHHFTFTLGSAFKVGVLPTYDNGSVQNKVRALAPMTFSMGYRGRFNAWGIDAFMRGGVGLQRESALRNTDGGHVDLDGLWSIGLQFLRYASPHSMMSIYYGAGALFDLTVFTAIKRESQRGDRDRERLTGGGLNLNFVLGVEFMRASPAQFFLQLVISAPVYPFELSSDSTSIKAYIPEVAATVGIMF